MARRVEMTSREWDGGAPAVWDAGRMVVRVVLVIGLVSLIGFVFGAGHAGHGFFFPWIFIPFAFMWFLSRPLGRRGRGRRRGGRDGRGDAAEWSVEQDDRRAPFASSSAYQAVDDGRLRLESELTTAQRRISELESQLQWQARLLEAAPPVRPVDRPNDQSHGQPHDQSPTQLS